MPLYHVVFLLLLVGAIIEYRKTKVSRRAFIAVFCILTLMLCLRYGQGTDFFAYEFIYNSVGNDLFRAWNNPTLHGEPGWLFVCWLFNVVGAPYPVFTFSVSIAMMYLFWRFISRFCKRPMLAMLISYHTLYLTYFMSALRQGVVVAIFLGLLLELLEKRRYWSYYLISIACMSIHSVAVTLLVIPLLDLKIFSQLKTILLLVVAAWALGFVISTGLLDGILLKILPASIRYYISQRGISLFAILERLGTFSVILVFSYLTRKEEKSTEHLLFLLKILCLGMIFYGAFLWLPLVASRFCFVYKCVEIAVISCLFTRKSALRRLLAMYCAALALVMYVKNINSYISDGCYYDNVSVVNYPYVSIFDAQQIKEYRDIRLSRDEKNSYYANIDMVLEKQLSNSFYTNIIP